MIVLRELRLTSLDRLMLPRNSKSGIEMGDVNPLQDARRVVRGDQA
jgi:hypothetical protein